MNHVKVLNQNSRQQQKSCRKERSHVLASIAVLTTQHASPIRSHHIPPSESFTALRSLHDIEMKGKQLSMSSWPIYFLDAEHSQHYILYDQRKPRACLRCGWKQHTRDLVNRIIGINRFCRWEWWRISSRLHNFRRRPPKWLHIRLDLRSISHEIRWAEASVYRSLQSSGSSTTHLQEYIFCQPSGRFHQEILHTTDRDFLLGNILRLYRSTSLPSFPKLCFAY